MPVRDEWGHDPSVRSMRKVFECMEGAQREVLGRINLSPFDSRLRRVREKARGLFETTWSLGVRQGMAMDEGHIASLYIHCLARALNSNGIEVPGEILPHDEGIIRLLSEGRR